MRMSMLMMNDTDDNVFGSNCDNDDDDDDDGDDDDDDGSSRKAKFE